MERYPKISIVTVNYNKASYLERTIKSVLDQGYPNLEYIIIDGGSQDGSVDIIRKYERELAYWVSEADEGMYYAIRKGFSHATGEILAWINSDDMYHRNSFFTVSEIFSSFQEIEWLVGYSTLWDDYDRCIYAFENKYFNHISFLRGDYKLIQQESSFWRKSLYDRVGGVCVDYKLAGDFALWMRFSRIAKMYVYNGLLGGFRYSKGDQLSKNMGKYIDECKAIIASEPILKEEKRLISSLNRNDFLCRVISRISKRFIDGEFFRNKVFKDQQLEAFRHHVYFNRATYSFSIRK